MTRFCVRSTYYETFLLIKIFDIENERATFALFKTFCLQLILYDFLNAVENKFLNV